MTPDRRQPTPATLWWLYAIGIAAFLPALRFYYVGEEAILTISSLEMGYHDEWIRQRFLGGNLKHNPLFNWLLIGICQLTGWEHVLAAARAISIAAVAGTGLVLAWLARRVTGEAGLGALAAVLYLMLSDLALYRGWLAYTDPLFGFFIFASSACLWVACRDRNRFLLGFSILLITAAVLTKAFTAYVFYGTLVFVLLFDREHRSFLLGFQSAMLHAAGLSLIVAWFGLVLGSGNQEARMFDEIINKLRPGNVVDYAAKLALFPLETMARLSPPLLLAGYYAARGAPRPSFQQPELRIALWVALLGFLPYWLAPSSHARYLVPLYPWVALACGLIIRQAGAAALSITLRWWVALFAVKLALFLVLFPAYQKIYRGENFAAAARQIVQRTAGYPLYTTNDSASGLAVAAHVDLLRLPAPPITFPPGDWDSGFVIAYEPDARTGRIAMQYRLGGRTLYLLCRGAACEGVKP